MVFCSRTTNFLQPKPKKTLKKTHQKLENVNTRDEKKKTVIEMSKKYFQNVLQKVSFKNKS